MCGIVGYIGNQQVTPFLLEGLKRLEYRGYDSAGIAVMAPDQQAITIKKQAGKVAELVSLCSQTQIEGTRGIAHTRWATHGAPTQNNAHPHANSEGTLALVHNGIIENHLELKEELEADGVVFASETDSEVVAHLVSRAFKKTGDISTALMEAIARVEGTYGIVVMHQDKPDRLAVARNGSPIVLASTPNGAYVASDLTALLEVTREVYTLENGQFATLFEDGAIKVFDEQGNSCEPSTLQIDWEVTATNAEGYEDFMLKEIMEQPEVAERLLKDRMMDGKIVLDGVNLTSEQIKAIDRVYMIACGTSYHAALVSKYLIEKWVHVPVEVEVASEFNYRDVYVGESTLCVVVTQSGETADTLNAAAKLRKMGAKVFACTNVLGSTAARESDGVIYMKAGPEVSVAATKSFTAQVLALMFLALFLAQEHETLTSEEINEIFGEFKRTPELLAQALTLREEAEAAAVYSEHAKSTLFIGRSCNYPTAQEGALKLKEISYLHAEAYPAGELKHGSIALIEQDYPVVVILPQDHLYSKTFSNVQEIVARGANVICVATKGDEEIKAFAKSVLAIEPAPDYLTPLLAIVPLQFYARAIARARGCDVDQPRNLAKCVTVE